MKTLLVLFFALGLASVGHCGIHVVSFTYAIDGQLTGSHGIGSGTATLNPATLEFCYEHSFSGLTGLVTASHFHGPAPVGANGPVLVTVSPPNSPVGPTCTTVSSIIAGHLLNELVYLNVHTNVFPGGEVRGHLQLA